MHLALLLHIYQPPTQYRKMLVRITGQSYERLVELLERYPGVRLTLNINASLSEQLAGAGYQGLLGRIRGLAERGQLELTGSAAYHPILTDLPKREIVRQINLNTKINQSHFGSAYRPSGFFPPELACDENLTAIVEELGFRWILVDGSAIADWRKFLRVIYKRRGGSLLVFPREDAVSFRIAFGRVRTVGGLVRAIGAGNLAKRQYVILAMDGETFGHHQPRQLAFLRALFMAAGRDRRLRLVTISELGRLYPKRSPTSIFRSTWGYTEVVGGKNLWVRWKNPRNPLHRLLDELRGLAMTAVGRGDGGARQLMDLALASDTYWWASGKPYWHPGMVRRGADLFCKVVLESPSATVQQRRRAKNLCNRELPQLFQRLRTRIQRKQILEYQGPKP